MSRSIDNGSRTHVRYAHAVRPRDVDVVCPRCGGCARATKLSERDAATLVGDLSPSWRAADWTIACGACPHRSAGLAYADLPALFWTVAVGDLEVWAWNREHLVFLGRHLSGEPTAGDVYGRLATYVPGDWQRQRDRVARGIRKKLLGPTMLNDATGRRLLAFCNGEIDAATFEAWVYADGELEGQIGHAAHLDLITADYRGREVAAARDRCAALLEQHHPGALSRHRVRSILRRMLDDRAAVIPGIRELVQFRHDGNEEIPIVFVAFDSELDGVPSPEHEHLWDPSFLRQIHAGTDAFVESIRQACAELLDDLRRRHPDDV